MQRIVARREMELYRLRNVLFRNHILWYDLRAAFQKTVCGNENQSRRESDFDFQTYTSAFYNFYRRNDIRSRFA